MDNSDWQALVERFSQSAQQQQLDEMLQFFLTPDEREALLVRAKIFQGLLDKSGSQRQLSQDLGVGIATITRGSTELKKHTPEERKQLEQFLKGLFAAPSDSSENDIS